MVADGASDPTAALLSLSCSCPCKARSTNSPSAQLPSLVHNVPPHFKSYVETQHTALQFKGKGGTPTFRAPIPSSQQGSP